MRRRKLLSVLAGGVAGCLGPGRDRGRRDSPSSDPATDPSTSGRPTAAVEPDVRRSVGEAYEPDDGAAVALSAPRFEKAFVAYYEPHYEIRNPVGWQFVVVDAAFEGERPDDFRANPFDGTALHPVVDGARPAAPASTLYQSGGYGTVVEGLGVPFPVGDATSAAVDWDRADGTTVRWELDPGTVGGLARAPRFRIETFAVAVRDDRVERFEVTVANGGDRDGRFRGLLRFPDRDRDPVVGLDVPAGERRTYRDLSKKATPRRVAGAFCGGVDVHLELSPGRTVPPATTCETPSPDGT